MNIKVFLFRLIGLYSIIMGIFYATVLSYTYRYAALPPILILSIVIISVSWLIIGGLLSFKKYSGILALTLIITQIIIEFLSGYTIGLFFVPVTVILIISEIGYKLIKSHKLE
jgi:hypothetical protein